jgi:hypothetical protein
LVKIGIPALGSLQTALQDSEGRVRKYAAQILGEIGDASVIEALTVALRDANYEVRDAAAGALQAIIVPPVVHTNDRSSLFDESAASIPKYHARERRFRRINVLVIAFTSAFLNLCGAFFFVPICMGLLLASGKAPAWLSSESGMLAAMLAPLVFGLIGSIAGAAIALLFNLAASKQISPGLEKRIENVLFVKEQSHSEIEHANIKTGTG